MSELSERVPDAPIRVRRLSLPELFADGGRAREVAPLIVAIVVTAVVFRIASPYFLTPRNLGNLLGQLAPLELIAVASTLMIVMGEIDLSLGSLAGFTGALSALFLLDDRVPWWLSVIGVIGAGIIASGIQGLIVVIGRVRSFAVTLAGFFIWYGVQLWILGPNSQIVVSRLPIANLASASISESVALIAVSVGGIVLIALWVALTRGQSRAVDVYGRAAAALVALGAIAWFIHYLGQVSLTFVLILAVTVVIWLLLTRTALGRHFYAVGGNVEAARSNGILVERVKWIGFALAGALAAFAGLTIVSYTGGADSSTGGGSLLLEGIGATVVGGVSLLGGRGSVWGAFGGAVLLAGVQNGLALLSLNFYVVDIVAGLVVLLALLTDAALRRRLVAS